MKLSEREPSYPSNWNNNNNILVFATCLGTTNLPALSAWALTLTYSKVVPLAYLTLGSVDCIQVQPKWKVLNFSFNEPTLQAVPQFALTLRSVQTSVGCFGSKTEPCIYLTVCDWRLIHFVNSTEVSFIPCQDHAAALVSAPIPFLAK